MFGAGAPDGMQQGINGGRAAAAAAVHTPVEPRTPLSPDEVVNTSAFKILAQFKTPKDIRVSVKGEYWERLPELRGKRLEGTIAQWAKKTPPDYTDSWSSGKMVATPSTWTNFFILK